MFFVYELVTLIKVVHRQRAKKNVVSNDTSTADVIDTNTDKEVKG